MPTRNVEGKIIFGVCSGLSEYYDIDVVTLRLIFLVGFLFIGITIIIYLVLALIMPPKDIKKNIAESNPIQILKERLAKGEITKDEFNDMKKVLEEL